MFCPSLVIIHKALGCLLYRICYFKSAFDGESKLQILNGNYRIPELPKYSASITRLIKDMLEGSPDARPDISQVWFRVNELFPMELQKHLPDSTESMLTLNMHLPFLDRSIEGTTNWTPLKPKRSLSPPSSIEKGGSISPKSHDEHHQMKPSHSPPIVGESANSFGAFWSTHFTQDSQTVEDKNQSFNEIQTFENSLTNQGRTGDWPSQTGIFKEIEDGETGGLDAFISDFNSNKQISRNTAISNNINKSAREEELEAEVEMLKEQLAQTNLEKEEVTSKYEKLSSICRSQRKEIQVLKLSQTMPIPPLAKGSPNTHALSSENSQFDTTSKEKIGGNTVNKWQVFSDESKAQTMPKTQISKSVWTTNGLSNSNKQRDPSSAVDEWGFGHDSFSASPSTGFETSIFPVLESSSQHFTASDVNKVESIQPAGWAGF